jgi:hypothetical protein
MKSNPKNKPSRIEFRLLVFLAVVPWIAFGCGSINPARMVPETLPPSAKKFGGSVRVMDVTGGKETTNSIQKWVTNDQFRQALILALDQSGLFGGVSTDRGDLDLYATINSESQPMSAQFTATMVVSYKFVNRAGDVVWSASYDSEFSSLSYFPTTRSLHAREGCVRENLSSLIQGITETWPKTGEVDPKM